MRLSPQQSMIYDTILFDLDGTLLNTSRGVKNSVNYAIRKMGFPCLSEEKLNSFIGPSPTNQYMKVFGISESLARKATAFHREYGQQFAVYEAEHYPSMMFTLHELKKFGFKLGVSTLKSQKIAETILKSYGLFKYFDVVVGMDQDETFKKADVIRRAMDKVGAKKAVMVGDTIDDYNGANQNQVDFIGALYGFGFNNEAEHDFKCIDCPYEILELLNLDVRCPYNLLCKAHFLVAINQSDDRVFESLEQLKETARNDEIYYLLNAFTA